MCVWLLALCSGQEDDRSPGFLRPTDRSRVPAGQFSIIARTAGAAQLWVDEREVAASQPTPQVLSATVTLTPGPHELKLTTAGRQFIVHVVAGDRAREEYRPFRVQPPAAGCTNCHKVAGPSWNLAKDNVSDLCAACHDLTKFPLVHQHAVAVLQECQMCHQPHGSTAEKHLKFNKATACKLCHG